MQCPSFCSKCEGEFNCTSCIPNAHLGDDNICHCNKGYNPKNKCSYIQTYFTASLLISTKNIVTLRFSEYPLIELNKTSIKVTLDSSPLNYSFEAISLREYLINPTLPEIITKGTKINIEILVFMRSVNNSLLTNYNISSNLNAQGSSTMQSLIAQAKALAQQGVASGLSAALGTGFVSFDPTSFFSFLSTAETYYPISLFDADLPEDLSTFLASLRVQTMVPNIFAYGISKEDGSEIPEKFKKLGFKSNLLLVNTGVNLSIGLLFLVILGVIKIMSYSLKLKPFVKKIKQMFEFGILLKFWVQSYLEFLLGSILTIKYNTFSSSLESFDFFLGLVVIVRFI